ncbi:MAG: YraN family protein [Chloroflexota bacterium]
MGDPRHELGGRGEDAVARWLTSAGWRVLARRWRVPEGELDIVALDDAGTLVAVEVRARRSARAGTAAESVDRRHVLRLRAALRRYAAEASPVHAGLRVDLVTLAPANEGAGPRWRATRLEAIDGW